MGYTFGRQLTIEALSEIAKKYKSRVEFKHKDSSAYSNATRKGVLNKICEHMLPLAFSVPQLISRQIFDQILGMESTYNDRKAIRPLELDIYYEQKKFAVEYCGRGWHYLPDVIERDAKKDFMCNEKHIFLFRIKERSRRYEEDIRDQIKENIPLLNTYLGLTLTDKIIDDIKIDYEKIFQPYDPEKVKKHVGECKNITEFKMKYKREYFVLMETGNLRLLSKINNAPKYFTNEELFAQCQNITSYHEFVSKYSNLYAVVLKRGILKEVSKHMVRENPVQVKHTKEELQEKVKKFRAENPTLFRSGFWEQYHNEYAAAQRMGIIEELFPMETRPEPKKITKEEIVACVKKFRAENPTLFRNGFLKQYPYEYKIAHRMKLMDELFPWDARPKKIGIKEDTGIDKQELVECAKLFRIKYPKLFRAEFAEKHPKEYKAARKLGIMEELFPMSTRPGKSELFRSTLLKNEGNNQQPTVLTFLGENI